MLRSSSLFSILAAALNSLVIFVHEVILVTQIIFINGDVAHSSRDGVFGGRLEVLEELLKGTCMSLAPRSVQANTERQPTLLRRIVNGCSKFTERHRGVAAVSN